MKIVDRKTFLALPFGVLYHKTEPCVFGEMCIKLDTWTNDWIYQDFPQFQNEGDIVESYDKLENR